MTLIMGDTRYIITQHGSAVQTDLTLPFMLACTYSAT
jgi:hypothetical protein